VHLLCPAAAADAAAAADCDDCGDCSASAVLGRNTFSSSVHSRVEGLLPVPATQDVAKPKHSSNCCTACSLPFLHSRVEGLLPVTFFMQGSSILQCLLIHHRRRYQGWTYQFISMQNTQVDTT